MVTLYFFFPAGVSTSISSPVFFSMNALPSGESVVLGHYLFITSISSFKLILPCFRMEISVLLAKSLL